MFTIWRTISILLIFLIMLVLLYFGVRGTLYWIDVRGRPDALKDETLQLDGVGEVQIYYPKSIQINNDKDEDYIELEFQPAQTPTQPGNVTVSLEETSKYLELQPEQVNISLSSGEQENPTIKILKRDFDAPPANVEIKITATEPQIGIFVEQTIGLTIDNILWRIIAIFAVVGGIVTFIGSVLALLRLR